ncbi:LysM peptidoglycan-binding domain-containing protein [Desulfatitalea alkaliphila]|uniref:LysM peptidoglycan-binding domain-containing protein n=1 Tax=Desulfatitalea alkaliphila TaxID=2929485 RepID=A0AA41R4U9_9BACT|nr:LysM peptidoglycan-binding domain-containing protein [Desulfatitalea alkaliphila]MCJ8501558.1 LysM peptidoglycan-binding domain-containing protein [Desulfatitalea alkaliphila]
MRRIDKTTSNPPKSIFFLPLLFLCCLAISGCAALPFLQAASESPATASSGSLPPSDSDAEPGEHLLETPTTHKNDVDAIIEDGGSTLAARPEAVAATVNCPDGDAECEATSADNAKEGQSRLDEALHLCEVSQSFWQKGELDSALDALDNAYALILDVDTRYDDIELIQQKEDLRFLISKRILEIYASRNIVVNGKHDEIPMEMNSYIEAELRRFTTGHEKDFFRRSLQRSGRYRPYIVEVLREAGLPEELSWLPLIESGYMVRALSSARALGLWQFIPSTGYKFGLRRTHYVDERMDFVKSTHAAVAYLKELHNIFGDWATVLAAYNCGEGRVLRVIRTQNVNYLDNFWDLYQRLPRETARYVPRFFATLHIVKNLEQYGLDQVALDAPFSYDEVDIHRQAHLRDIGKPIGANLATLEALNPELRHRIVPPEPYTLRVPEGSGATLLADIDTIPTSKLPQQAHTWHTVRSGETLGAIARRYRTSVNRIMQTNNLRSSHFIRAGTRLRIPLSGSGAVAAGRQQPSTPPASGVHTVVKGDSLWNIANRYGTTVQQITALNRLSSNTLQIGQRLRIPGHQPQPSPKTGELNTYQVKRGDSPFTIARKHNMPLERFLRINQLSKRSTIYPGQEVYID